MTRLSKFMLGTATALAAMTANAMAQTPSGDSDKTTTDPTTTADPNASTDPNAATTPGVTGSTTPGATDAWSTEIIDRPLTLNAGMVGATGSLGFAHLSLGPLGSTDSEGLNVAGEYGVNNQITVGAGYGLTLNEFEAKGPLDVHALYRLAQGKLKAAADVRFGYSFGTENGDVSLGAAVAYDVTPTVAIFTGGDQISLGVIRSMDAPSPIDLRVPVGVELQATPNVFAFLDTQLASFGISNSSNVFISDITPLTVGAFYSPSNKMDLGIQADFLDLQHAGDIFAILATARIFKI